MDRILPDADEIAQAAQLVYRYMQPTAQHRWPLLDRLSGAVVTVKHENHTPLGAFKVRGGLTFAAALRAVMPQINGIITATRGNHGQSVAFAAARFGLSATIVVPYGNSREKNQAMAALGGELVEHGHDFQAAFEYACALERSRGLYRLPSFHPWLVRGVSTYGWEFLRACPALDTVYVPIGLGSGICGVFAARNALGLKTKIVGVVAARAASYALSFAAGKPVPTNSADTMADGVAVRVPDADAVAIVNAQADRIVSVEEDEIEAAIRHYLSATHNVAEGAGAVALAALLKERQRMAGKQVGLVLSGGNIDRADLAAVLARDGADVAA